MNTFEFSVDVILERVLPLLIGSGLAFLAIAGAYDSFRRLFRGMIVAGVVVGYERVEGCYCPVVEFTARDGSQRRFTAGAGRGTKRYSEGSRVGIIYDPAKPERAEIRAFSALWLFPLVLAGFAAVFLCVGLRVF